MDQIVTEIHSLPVIMNLKECTMGVGLLLPNSTNFYCTIHQFFPIGGLIHSRSRETGRADQTTT